MFYRLIAHRGNMWGPNTDWENVPVYVQKAIDQGFDVEIDLWENHGNLYLGHTWGEHQIDIQWLLDRRDKLWIHCKNIQALEFCDNYEGVLHYFWHQSDDYVLTSERYVWTYPGKPVPHCGVMVNKDCKILPAGMLCMCSDWVGEVKKNVGS